MLNVAIALAVLTGTALQMLLALVDAREAHKDALAWARTEDELIREQPWRRRRGVRRELMAWRDPDTDRSLAYVDAVLFSWTVLVGASAAAVVASASDA